MGSQRPAALALLDSLLHLTMLLRWRGVLEGMRAHTVSPGENAAKEKGSAGPVRRRRKTGTLDEIWHKGNPPSMAGIKEILKFRIKIS